jgi:hypothetical protein
MTAAPRTRSLVTASASVQCRILTAGQPRPAGFIFLDYKYRSLISLEICLFVAAAGETISGHADECAEQHTMRASWRPMGKSAKALS